MKANFSAWRLMSMSQCLVCTVKEHHEGQVVLRGTQGPNESATGHVCFSPSIYAGCTVEQKCRGAVSVWSIHVPQESSK